MAVAADISQPASHQRIPMPRWIALVLLALIAFLGVSRLLHTTTMIDHVTIRNDSGYDLDVDATGVAHDGWTPVGIALAHAATEVRDVVDHGDVWIFRFRGQARDGGEVRVTRAELEAGDWTVAVPAAVADRIGSAGGVPNPS